MLFVLTRQDYDETDILGLFSTADKAKDYAENVLGNNNLKWSTPNMVGTVWSNASGGSLFINPAELDPTTA